MSGPEHPGTLIVRGNLAYWTGQAGDPAAARDLFAELVPVFERVLGPEHPDALTVRGNLTRWTERAERDPGTGVLLRHRTQFYARDAGDLSEIMGHYL